MADVRAARSVDRMPEKFTELAGQELSGCRLNLHGETHSAFLRGAEPTSHSACSHACVAVPQVVLSDRK